GVAPPLETSEAPEVRVGAGDQRLGVVRGPQLREAGPETDTGASLQVGRNVGEHTLRARAAGLRQRADELVAAPTDDQVGGPEAAPQGGGQFLDLDVPGGVALLVVDGLQADAVQEHDDQL